MHPDFLIDETAKIVSAYACRNATTKSGLIAAITSVHEALYNLSSCENIYGKTVEILSEKQIEKTISQDRLISLIDGKSYKTLKRHLTKHGFTPEKYRERFGLPHDYPMVAPAYAALRARLARQIHLDYEAA